MPFKDHFKSELDPFGGVEVEIKEPSEQKVVGPGVSVEPEYAAPDTASAHGHLTPFQQMLVDPTRVKFLKQGVALPYAAASSPVYSLCAAWLTHDAKSLKPGEVRVPFWNLPVETVRSMTLKGIKPSALFLGGRVILRTLGAGPINSYSKELADANGWSKEQTSAFVSSLQFCNLLAADAAVTPLEKLSVRTQLHAKAAKEGLAVGEAPKLLETTYGTRLRDIGVHLASKAPLGASMLGAKFAAQNYWPEKSEILGDDGSFQRVVSVSLFASLVGAGVNFATMPATSFARNIWANDAVSAREAWDGVMDKSQGGGWRGWKPKLGMSLVGAMVMMLTLTTKEYLDKQSQLARELSEDDCLKVMQSGKEAVMLKDPCDPKQVNGFLQAFADFVGRFNDMPCSERLKNAVRFKQEIDILQEHGIDNLPDEVKSGCIETSRALDGFVEGVEKKFEEQKAMTEYVRELEACARAKDEFLRRNLSPTAYGFVSHSSTEGEQRGSDAPGLCVVS